VRITGGQFRGRIIRPPANLPVRPTTDFAKTALFNILSNHFDFEKIKVLDLFSGTGAISYEFASRGTKEIRAVDKDLRSISFIKKTMVELKIAGLQALYADAFKFIDNITEKYDIIFADPPFELEQTDTLPDTVFSRDLLVAGGWLIIEHQSKRILKSNILPSEVRKYSNCSYSIFRHE
jgi:16S rRNA (guanine966-N2)-methyltransferase